MIQTENLSKKFNDFLAVSQVCLQVNAGEVLALLGPNGAGKTTTLRMLAAVVRPTLGWARVAGYDVVTQPAEVRASVGILTEQRGLYGRMNAVEYLVFFGQIYRMGAPTRRSRTDELLEQFGLGDERKRKIGEYSKGMRQKLALARALFHNPPVLLMDEPTSAMDPESARLVRDAIRGVSSIELGQVLPAGINLTGKGPGWFHYQTENPAEMNPLVIQSLVAHAVPVLGLTEVPRSLEEVYLQAIGTGNTGQPGVGR